MKIKKIISINLVNSNLNVYKLGQIENTLKIKCVNLKPYSKYLELEHNLPKSNISLVRNKTDSLTHYAHGYTPNTSYYLMPASSEDSCTCYKINSVYKFNTKFREEDVEKSVLQFRKVESREEIEHRKRNINYKIKNLENEIFNRMEYKKLDRDIMTLNLSNIPKKDIKFNIGKIERCIKNRVVVNYKDLYNLFKPSYTNTHERFLSDNIKLSLQRLTFYYKGRYLLKNKFYDKYLQEVRNKILKAFENTDRLIKLESDSIDYKTIIDELCIKKNDGYHLKGYYEDLVIDFKNLGLLNDLRNKLIFSFQDIKNISGLEMEDVYKFVNENNLVEIRNNFYCIELSREIEEVIGLLDKVNIKKSEINELVTEKGLNVEEFFKILEKYYVLKRATWVRI
jgi:hypothetical protein